MCIAKQEIGDVYQYVTISFCADCPAPQDRFSEGFLDGEPLQFVFGLRTVLQIDVFEEDLVAMAFEFDDATAVELPPVQA